MKDRFRFRAWNKEEKQMYYDAQNTYDYMTGNPIIFAESFSCLLTNDETWEVEQCTGLKDKNGNLIYEGDVLLLRNNKFEVGHNNITVFFKCLTDEYTHIDPMDFDYDESEIIGNTHETLECMQKKITPEEFAELELLVNATFK